VADKKHGSGFYVNVIFSGEAPVVAQLRSRFTLSEDVFRALFTVAPPAKAAAAA
jgi:ribosomal protein S6